MSDCTDKNLREKLFTYELAILSGEERRELEEHLYECDACYHDLDQFADWAEYLRDEKSVRDSVLSDADQVKKENRKPVITRLLLTVAAVLVLTIPTYFLWLQPPDVDITQRINLVPTRALASGVIDLEYGGNAEIGFVAEGIRTGHTYLVTIASRDKNVVYQETYSEFNESGLGSLVVPVDTFEAGFYSLSVTDPSDTPPSTLVEYTFRVE
jgi:hypothetical protein